MDAQEVKFKRKTTEQIENLEIEDGALIYNIDNGKTYMDYGNQRIQTGGNADTMIYVGDDEPTDPDIVLWIDENENNSKASEIVNEYTETDKYAYSCNYINETINDNINGYILYENTTGTSSNFTISDTYTNYQQIDVVVTKGDIQQIVSFNPNLSRTVSCTLYEQNSSTVMTLYNTILIFEGMNVTLHGNSVAFNSNLQIPGFASNVESKIKKVVGYGKIN